MSYQFFHVRDNSSSNPLGLLSFLHERSRGNANWGIFPGLFGLGTNEAYWMFYGDDPGNHFGQSDHIEVLDHVVLQGTVRPIEYEERSKQGVYVFRWFEVAPEKIDQVVALSDEAWKTFEGGFDTEVQGLFTVEPTLGRYRMVLVTWYQNLTVWQESREPDEKARQLFVQRQGLLDSARPIATRLWVGS